MSCAVSGCMSLYDLGRPSCRRRWKRTFEEFRAAAQARLDVGHAQRGAGQVERRFRLNCRTNALVAP